MKQLLLFDIDITPFFSRDEIQQHLIAENFIGGGVECSVYRITETMCFKYYPEFEPYEIIEIFERAKMIFGYNLAPSVYQLFEDGYTTEIVETLTKECCECCGDRYDCAEICDDLSDENGFVLLDFAEFRNEIYHLSPEFHDLHNENIGLKNGCFVAIDFGIASF